MNLFLTEIVTNPIFPVFIGLICFLGGHHFSVGREKRKEFNEIAEPLNMRLEKEIDSPGSFTYPRKDFLLIERRMGILERWRFRRACKNYSYWTFSSPNLVYPDGGGFYYKDFSKVDSSIRRVQKFLKRK
ncbi:MAG: hypothetical protein MI748_08665 [Opitutales bacterium]|nr:hypothetical protein [Opitutales bacterium]